MSTSAIEHRRTRRPGAIDISAAFTLTVIPNLQFWFRPESLDFDNNDKVNVWPDESGNRNHATQYQAERPTFIENIINGYPVVRFAGSNSLGHTVVNYDQASHFVVWSRTGATNNDAVLVTTGVVYSYLQYSGDWYAANGAGDAVAMAADTFMLKACTYDNTSIIRYTNSSAESTLSNSSNAQYAFMGHPDFLLNGDIAETIIFDRVLTTGERQLVESYLNAKYGLW